VPRGQLQTQIDTYESLPIQGYSVTIPHKEGAALLAAKPDEIVLQTKAANTLVRLEGGGFAAANTDYQAVLDTLTYAMPPSADGSPPTLEGKMVLMLGAGGVARAVAHALKQAGCVITISNRTPEKAHRVAAEIEARVLDWMGRHTAVCDILVNATSVGMHPNVDDTPIHAGFFTPEMLVFDTVYTPETTLMIKEARARSSRVVTGVELFARQAALQFEMFTGQEAGLDQIRQIVRRALSPVTTMPEEDEGNASA